MEILRDTVMMNTFIQTHKTHTIKSELQYKLRTGDNDYQFGW